MLEVSQAGGLAHQLLLTHDESVTIQRRPGSQRPSPEAHFSGELENGYKIVE
jgi:hypothetical protein